MNVWNVIRMKMDKNAWASPDAPYPPPILLYIRKVIFYPRSKDKEKKRPKDGNEHTCIEKKKDEQASPSVPFGFRRHLHRVKRKMSKQAKHLAQVLEQKLNCCFLSPYLGLWSIYIYIYLQTIIFILLPFLISCERVDRKGVSPDGPICRASQSAWETTLWEKQTDEDHNTWLMLMLSSEENIEVPHSQHITSRVWYSPGYFIPWLKFEEIEIPFSTTV